VPRPDGFIYLRTQPEVCHDRLKKRDRHEESSVSLDYIQTIHDKHERWLIEKKDLNAKMEKIPVLVLDCNAEFETDLKEQQRHVESVSSFILSCIPTSQAEPPISTLSL
jgi:deoxyadenosine/deoxycytidine kinase